MSDNSHLVFLDLCSGLGGASQPAKDRGWTVIRVDIDPRFKPDIVADVRSLPLKPFYVDVLWASFPCQQFSKFEMRCFFPNPPEPDLSIALAVKRIVEEWGPRYWAVENVRASRRWLTPLFGPVRLCTTGHVIWSNLGFLVPPLRPHKGSFNAKHASGKRWGAVSHAERRRRHGIHGPFVKDDAAIAAIVPYEIGDSIAKQVEWAYSEAHENTSQ